MKTMTATEAAQRIEHHAADKEVRDASTVPVGCGFYQGDLYFARIDNEKKITGARIEHMQLVPGLSRGSRHIVEGGVELYEADASLLPEWVSPNALLAPVVRVGEAGARLTHPTHAHFLLPMNSKWVTWQQMDARTKRRVED